MVKPNEEPTATAEVDAIHIDEPTAYERAKEFLQLVMPRYVNRLHLYEGREPLFHKHNLDEEIVRSILTFSIFITMTIGLLALAGVAFLAYVLLKTK